jgi:hypothetical protein
VNGGAPASDQIELVGFLTAPGTLSITIDGNTMTKDVPAGVTSFTVPFASGTPHFALERQGAQVFGFDGGIAIAGAGGLDGGTLDLTYWSGSASASGACHMTMPTP